MNELRKIIEETDFCSSYCLSINNYELKIDFNFWLPSLPDFVERKNCDRQNIFEFYISFDRVVKSE